MKIQRGGQTRALGKGLPRGGIDHFDSICHNSTHHNIRGDNHFDRMQDARSNYSPLCLPYLPQGIWVNIIRPVSNRETHSNTLTAV